LKSFITLILGITLLTFACTNQNKTAHYTKVEIDSLKNEFIQYCQVKDTNFKKAEWSPLKPGDKANFSGLHYFNYDISFRYKLKIQTYSNQDTIEIPGSKSGDLRKAIHHGYFKFEINGRTHQLEVLKLMPHKKVGEAYLFLGFWDETSGKETYPGGRYLDIKEVEPDIYLVDFNYAYNPYCAYNDQYSCLIPLLENRLSDALKCGEKIYKKH
jgi:uncharacterized protein (DUF1684 family)